MSVVKKPVIHATSGDSAFEALRMGHYEHSGHSATEREPFYADSRRIHIRKGAQVIGPAHEILHRYAYQVSIYQVNSGPAVMSCSTGVGHHLYDSVIIVPHIPVADSTPPVIHVRGVRTAVDFHNQRILFRRVEILRQGYAGRNPG